MSRQILDILADLSEDEQLKEAAEKHAHQPEMQNPSGEGAEGEIGAQMGGTQMDARAVLHEKAMQSAGDELDARTWDDPRENLTQQATAPVGVQGVAPSDTGRNVRETKTTLPSKTAMKMPDFRRAGRYVAGKTTAGGKYVAGKATAGGKYVAAKTTAGGKYVAAKTTAGGKYVAGKAKENRGVLIAGAAGGGVGAAGGYASGRKKKASLAEYVSILDREDGEKVASEHFSGEELADLNLQVERGLFMGRAMAIGQMKQAAGL